ncbi:MAG: hypothetical protein ACKOCX_09750 [Planctomycetota bacterium]
MSKALAFTGLIISGLVVILFVADLAAAFPFKRVSWMADLAFIFSGLITAYLSWMLMPTAGRRS